NVVERNNALLVFDTRANINEIRSAVRDLDVETYQVNIQAQLIQVDSDALREIGVDWQFGVGSGNLTELRSNPGQIGAIKTDFGMVGTSNHGSQATGTESGGGGSGEVAGGIVGGVAGATTQLAFGLLNGNLAVAVANLVKNLRGEALAKTQITTIDNSEARIFMGEKVPIRVLDANGRQAIQLQDAGTSLTVTHHVTADGRILLDLLPEKYFFRVDPSSGTIIQNQSAKTTVVVGDGETVVISCLTTKEETTTETGVPLLKDVPLIGYLFKHSATSSRKRDLIIFVTPHIVAQANRPDGLARKDNDYYAPSSESQGVYGDYSAPSKAAPSAQPKAAPDTLRGGRQDYPN